jgi:hypothetical protein
MSTTPAGDRARAPAGDLAGQQDLHPRLGSQLLHALPRRLDLDEHSNALSPI